MNALRRVTIADAMVLIALAVAPTRPAAGASDLPNATPRQLEEITRLIERRYVREIPKDSLADATERCLTRTLDPYSVYQNRDTSSQFNRDIAGRFGGIGAVMRLDSASSAIVIVGLFRDSPALQAGVRAGDTLVSVAGHPVAGRGLEEVLDQVRGPVGSQARMVIRRAGEPSPRAFSIRRAIIEVPSVRGIRSADSESDRYLIGDSARTAYVRVDFITARTDVELSRALAAVERAGARGLVLDLRENSGGVMSRAIAAADQFLDAGTIVTVRARGEHPTVYRAKSGVATRVPMAVLIDGYTASSAEILAAGLQDQHRALVVGSRSWGKGVGQQLLKLKRSPGQLKLTTFTFERPSGRPMERRVQGLQSEQGGVWPDSGLAVSLSEAEAQSWGDSTYAVGSRMQLVGSPNDPIAIPNDRVLRRALEALASGRRP